MSNATCIGWVRHSCLTSGSVLTDGYLSLFQEVSGDEYIAGVRQECLTYRS